MNRVPTLPPEATEADYEAAVREMSVRIDEMIARMRRNRERIESDRRETRVLLDRINARF